MIEVAKGLAAGAVGGDDGSEASSEGWSQFLTAIRATS
jgi:hypothetical protein